MHKAITTLGYAEYFDLHRLQPYEYFGAILQKGNYSFLTLLSYVPKDLCEPIGVLNKLNPQDFEDDSSLLALICNPKINKSHAVALTVKDGKWLNLGMDIQMDMALNNIGDGVVIAIGAICELIGDSYEPTKIRNYATS